MPPACRCSRYPELCGNPITAEDLQCDPCRGGACAMRWRGLPAGWQYDTHVTWPDAPTHEAAAAAMQQLQEQFPGESSWVDATGRGPLHLVDPAGRPYLNPARPFTPHDHNGVPCVPAG